jgi:hypothetical protein
MSSTADLLSSTASTLATVSMSTVASTLSTAHHASTAHSGEHGGGHHKVVCMAILEQS